MPFEGEPTGYEKSVLSELQGAWQNLRGEVAEQAGFYGWCCLSDYFTAHFPEYFREQHLSFPTLIAPVEQS
jgi:hypothetical protein